MEYQDEEADPRSDWQKRTAWLVEQSKKADREDKELADDMEKLVNFAPFRRYLERVLGPRIQTMADQLMVPLSGIDATLAQEYLKGAMSGLIIARDLPSVIIASIAEIRPAPAAADED